MVGPLDRGDVRFKPKNFELDMEHRESPRTKSSIEEAPKLELKTLPPHLRYVFLGKDDSLFVIIASDLNVHQLGGLIKVLKRFKRAIGLTIANIIWIHSYICSHQIKLLSDHKQKIEHQRRLNLPMQEVVKKEIIKWLDAEVIYPIGDSSWVCAVHCVPKRGGMIVHPNDKNEIVPI